MATTVMDLPMEMLVKIFSFLKPKEAANLFVVCSRFNAAAKDPSLWRRGVFKFNSRDKRKIESFCSFFSKNPFFRALSITKLYPCGITHLNSLNYLFQNLKHLTCLEFQFDLSNIILPASLLHLSLNIFSEVCKEDQFRFVEQCPNIERLHLENTCPIDTIRSVLLKYQYTLSALYLSYFDDEWIPLIENCLSLKEFGIITFGDHVNLSVLFGFLSSRLELLYVNSIDVPRSFNDFKFPKLKDLTIESANEDLMDIIPELKRMPKLHSLHFLCQANNLNVGDFCSVIKNCKTLRFLSIYNFDEPSVGIFDTVIKELNEGSSEKNQWKLSMEKFRRLTPCKCYCWDPSQISVDHIRHKQFQWEESFESDSEYTASGSQCSSSDSECTSSDFECTSSDFEYTASGSQCSSSDSECTSDFEYTSSDSECTSSDSRCTSSDSECTSSNSEYTSFDSRCTSSDSECTSSDSRCTSSDSRCTSSDSECTSSDSRCTSSDSQSTSSDSECTSSDSRCTSSDSQSTSSDSGEDLGIWA